MIAVIEDKELIEQLKAERAASGADRYDEVWEGEYVMAAQPNDEHQNLATSLSSPIWMIIQYPGLGEVRTGTNVSDREDWKENYRCPDVAVFLKGSKAKWRPAFWLGGPDFAIEIVGPGDRTRKKLPFYASVGTRELLIIDRKPWKLELFRLRRDKLVSVGESTVKDRQAIASEVLPMTFRFAAGEERPMVVMTHTVDGANWKV